jgi:hypothetical protein
LSDKGSACGPADLRHAEIDATCGGAAESLIAMNSPKGGANRFRLRPRLGPHARCDERDGGRHGSAAAQPAQVAADAMTRPCDDSGHTRNRDDSLTRR